MLEESQRIQAGLETEIEEARNACQQESSVLASLSIENHQLVQELEGGAESYDLTKSDWKYGCSNGVFATPSVFINGVQVYGYSLMGGHHAEGDLAAMSLADWQALLDPLVEAAEAAQPSLWQGRSASTPS